MNELSSTVGWREWAALPDLGIPAIKVKIDTGARTSALHALNIEKFVVDGTDMVRFDVQPLQRNSTVVLPIEAPLVGMRSVSDSGGHSEERCVIRTTIKMGVMNREIDITLTSRKTMLFRMLIGRTALANSVLVDPAASYLGGRVYAKQLYATQLESRA